MTLLPVSVTPACLWSLAPPRLCGFLRGHIVKIAAYRWRYTFNQCNHNFNQGTSIVFLVTSLPLYLDNQASPE